MLLVGSYYWEGEEEGTQREKMATLKNPTKQTNQTKKQNKKTPEQPKTHNLGFSRNVSTWPGTFVLRSEANIINKEWGGKKPDWVGTTPGIHWIAEVMATQWAWFYHNN